MNIKNTKKKLKQYTPFYGNVESWKVRARAAQAGQYFRHYMNRPRSCMECEFASKRKMGSLPAFDIVYLVRSTLLCILDLGGPSGANV